MIYIYVSPTSEQMGIANLLVLFYNIINLLKQLLGLCMHANLNANEPHPGTVCKLGATPIGPRQKDLSRYH